MLSSAIGSIGFSWIGLREGGIKKSKNWLTATGKSDTVHTRPHTSMGFLQMHRWHLESRPSTKEVQHVLTPTLK
ncbi:hypothetical protein EVAR_72932_1, partial [Eumeta japonica]